MNKKFAKVKKYYEYILTQMKVLKNQKTFLYEGTQVHYMYKKVEGAKNLAIVFSACTRAGVPARYNYVRTMESVPCNQLFILDDFGPDKRGSYYLGRYPEFKEEEATLALIQKFQKDVQPDKTIFCGSCKGAYAAIDFGCRFPNSIIIAGEPTYKIATEFALAEDLMHYWMGEINEENIQKIDEHLKNTLKDNRRKTQKLYLFYSSVDEYYERHTKPLLDDLKEFAYPTEMEAGNFEKHADLSLYFPQYLKDKIGVCL